MTGPYGRVRRPGLHSGGALVGVLGLALGLALGAGCRAQNPDHCLHRAADSDAWCAINTTGTPYCSPCAADNHGCVAAPPTACPDYDPDKGDDLSSSGAESSSGASA